MQEEKILLKQSSILEDLDKARIKMHNLKGIMSPEQNQIAGIEVKHLNNSLRTDDLPVFSTYFTSLSNRNESLANFPIVSVFGHFQGQENIISNNMIISQDARTELLSKLKQVHPYLKIDFAKF
jgi:hypothetical protein